MLLHWLQRRWQGSSGHVLGKSLTWEGRPEKERRQHTMLLVSVEQSLCFCLTLSLLWLQVCLMVPWGLQLLFYSFLYRAFPRDRDRSMELDREGRLRHSSSETGILAPGGENKLLPASSLGPRCC